MKILNEQHLCKTHYSYIAWTSVNTESQNIRIKWSPPESQAASFSRPIQDILTPFSGRRSNRYREVGHVAAAAAAAETLYAPRALGFDRSLRIGLFGAALLFR